MLAVENRRRRNTGAVSFAPTTRQPALRVGAFAAGLAGVLAIILGTFLPWVVSGQVSRNLYTIAGVADRIGLLGPGDSVSGWLALTGPLCILPVLLAVLRLRRSAAVLGLLVAVLAGGFAGTVLALLAGRSRLGVHLALPGPVTVLVGAVLLAAAAIGLLIVEAAARRRRPGAARAPLGNPPSAAGRPDW